MKVVSVKKTFAFTLFFILISALFWLGFSIIVATGFHPALPDHKLYQGIMAGLAFLSAAFLFFLYFLLRSKNNFAFYLTIAFLTFLAILTVMDDLGIIDFLVLIITILPIVLLIKDRKWYFQPRTKL